jgi:putative intracellular protease/amidase
MKTYLYVLDTMADWEIGYLTAELNSRRYFNPDVKPDHELIFVGKDDVPITTMGGLHVTPSQTLNPDDFKDEDLLVLPGSDIWLDGEHDQILHLAKGLIEKKERVAAICGATVALACIGALDSVDHTSTDKAFLQMICPRYAGGEHYVDLPVVVDDNLITASPIAAVEFTKEVLGLLGVFKEDTLEAWYKLYQSRDPQWFPALMATMNPEN